MKKALTDQVLSLLMQHLLSVYSPILCSVQIPSQILCHNFKHLSLQDKLQSRLACRSWCEVCPAQTSNHRLYLQYQDDWQNSAEHIRRYCPSVSIVLSVTDLADLGPLLANPLCDVVLWTPPSARVGLWDLASEAAISQSAASVLRDLSQVEVYIDGPQVKLATAHPQPEQNSPDNQVDLFSPVPLRAEGLELCLTLRCGHLGSRDAQSLVAKLQGAIYELRVLGSLVFSSYILPMNNLRVLAFLLTRKAKLTQYWSVLEAMPNLEFLQVYSETEKAAARIPDFLQVMPRLKKVTTLKVATDHFFLCLPAKHLQNVTHPQLGGQVTADHLPTALRLLHLEVFNDGLNADAYLPLFWEIDLHDTPIELALDNFTAAALQHLPTKLHGLMLLHSFEEGSSSALQMFQFHQALARLPMLRSLVIPDFSHPMYLICCQA